jgi:hypothetical protein
VCEENTTHTHTRGSLSLPPGNVFSQAVTARALACAQDGLEKEKLRLEQSQKALGDELQQARKATRSLREKMVAEKQKVSERASEHTLLPHTGLGWNRTSSTHTHTHTHTDTHANHTAGIASHRRPPSPKRGQPPTLHRPSSHGSWRRRRTGGRSCATGCTMG